MENVEFFIINGQTCISRNGVSSPLSEKDRDVIQFMIQQLHMYFPDALQQLQVWAAESMSNRWYYEYRIVDRFIRCNFGEADFMHPDLDDLGMFHFEEVKCPLRTICKMEGTVCKPKVKTVLSEEEERVAKLYAKGYVPGEIAEKLGKSVNTCKTLLMKACKKLKLPNRRWLIRLFSIYNVTNF
ncbi:MAG: LuxR family transcriptional regulator [Prevotella sp.]|nr:LuxR family transcriptional regulator [Prevotella sp.]